MLFAVTALACALVPATAFAADPTTDQYASRLDQITQGGGGEAGGVATSGDGGGSVVSSLPFTGLDLALLAAVAAGLVAAGLLLRRRRVAEAHE